MTVDELNFPRYKVIADYPESMFNVNHIIQINNTEFGNSFFAKYPHLFKKLEWWENREPAEMPEFLNIKRYNQIIRVTNWRISMRHPYCDISEFKGPFAGHISDWLPATKEEYESQNKTK